MLKNDNFLFKFLVKLIILLIIYNFGYILSQNFKKKK